MLVDVLCNSVLASSHEENLTVISDFWSQKALNMPKVQDGINLLIEVMISGYLLYNFRG